MLAAVDPGIAEAPAADDGAFGDMPEQLHLAEIVLRRHLPEGVVEGVDERIQLFCFDGVDFHVRPP